MVSVCGVLRCSVCSGKVPVLPVVFPGVCMLIILLWSLLWCFDSLSCRLYMINSTVLGVMHAMTMISY